MTDDLFTLGGPEGRNQDAARFEDQFVAMGSTLGWHPVCRNVDMHLDSGGTSRGVDVLWGLRNPQTGAAEGWLGEAKRLSGPERYTPKKLQDDFQTLRDKIAR